MKTEMAGWAQIYRKSCLSKICTFIKYYARFMYLEKSLVGDQRTISLLKFWINFCSSRSRNIAHNRKMYIVLHIESRSQQKIVSRTPLVRRFQKRKKEVNDYFTSDVICLLWCPRGKCTRARSDLLLKRMAKTTELNVSLLCAVENKTLGGSANARLRGF